MSKDLHIRISDELDFMITILEKELGMTRSDIVREAIKLYFTYNIVMKKNIKGGAKNESR